MWKNTLCNLDKYIFEFGQIHVLLAAEVNSGHLWPYSTTSSLGILFPVRPHQYTANVNPHILGGPDLIKHPGISSSFIIGNNHKQRFLLGNL